MSWLGWLIAAYAASRWRRAAWEADCLRASSGHYRDWWAAAVAKRGGRPD